MKEETNIEYMFREEPAKLAAELVSLLNERDRVDFVERLVDGVPNKAKEIAKMINITIRDSALNFMD
jgi:hypothetical protein|tara:strand:+ start:69 stop:269 length:201 start_codon:yes stop_codon:yes gene_type:complete